MLNKFEDIQESINDKINHVVTDLFPNPIPELEKVLNKAHQKSSDNVESIKEAIEAYEMEFNKLQMNS